MPPKRAPFTPNRPATKKADVSHSPATAATAAAANQQPPESSPDSSVKSKGNGNQDGLNAFSDSPEKPTSAVLRLTRPVSWDFKLPDERDAALSGACAKCRVPHMLELMQQIGSVDGFCNYVTIECNVIDVPTCCPRCKGPLTKPNKDGVIRRNRRHCRKQREWSVSIYKGTFFEGASNGK